MRAWEVEIEIMHVCQVEEPTIRLLTGKHRVKFGEDWIVIARKFTFEALFEILDWHIRVALVDIFNLSVLLVKGVVRITSRDGLDFLVVDLRLVLVNGLKALGAFMGSVEEIGDLMVSTKPFADTLWFEEETVGDGLLKPLKFLMNEALVFKQHVVEQLDALSQFKTD